MAMSDKVKALMKLKGKDNASLAEYLSMSKQALSNKFYRDSFSGADLIKIADFLECNLAFVIDNSQKINFEMSDISTEL